MCCHYTTSPFYPVMAWCILLGYEGSKRGTLQEERRMDADDGLLRIKGQRAASIDVSNSTTCRTEVSKSRRSTRRLRAVREVGAVSDRSVEQGDVQRLYWSAVCYHEPRLESTGATYWQKRNCIGHCELTLARFERATF